MLYFLWCVEVCHAYVSVLSLSSALCPKLLASTAERQLSLNDICFCTFYLYSIFFHLYLSLYYYFYSICILFAFYYCFICIWTPLKICICICKYTCIQHKLLQCTLRWPLRYNLIPGWGIIIFFICICIWFRISLFVCIFVNTNDFSALLAGHQYALRFEGKES